MELADYLKIVRRRWWMVLLAVVLCAGGAAAATYSKAPQYTANTRLLVSGVQGSSAIDEISKRGLAVQRADAYAKLVSTGPAIATARETAGATTPATVTAYSDGDSPFIYITVVAGSAKDAAGVANVYVKVLPRIVATLEQTSSQQAQFSVLEAASVPGSPSSPNPPRDILVGVIIGLVLGLAAALARETLDARIRDSAELEKLTGVTMLGSIPREHATDRLPSMTRPRSGRAEAYRHVRTNLEFTTSEGMPRSVVVTSPAPGEGKSSLSTNLAVVAARSGRNVVIVDADLRKPTVAKVFGLQSPVGLSDVLTGRWTWQEALVPVEGENIHVLASGPVPKFPSELVGSTRMAQLVQELEAAFDFVIIDTPPVLPVSDALVMGVNAGGVIVVARMIETRRAALKRAVEAVQKVNANLLGVVGNAVVKAEEKAYGEGYGYAYGYISDAQAEANPMPEVRPAARRPDTRRGRHSGSPTTGHEPDVVERLLGPGGGHPSGHVPPAHPTHPAHPYAGPVPPGASAHPYLGAGYVGPPQPYYGQQPPAAPPVGPGAIRGAQMSAPANSGYYPGPVAPDPHGADFEVPTDWGSTPPPASPIPPMNLDDLFRRPRND